jgi:hypothetical protein
MHTTDLGRMRGFSLYHMTNSHDIHEGVNKNHFPDQRVPCYKITKRDRKSFGHISNYFKVE